MDTKEAIRLVEKAFGIWEDEYCYSEVSGKGMNEAVELLKRSEINQKIIDKMKNEKYDVWISLPGSFTNIPKFIRDIEKEVNND